MADVLTKATKQAEEAGAKASQETFNGLTLHILREAADEKPKEKDQEKAEGDGSPTSPLAWTESEGVFYFSFAARQRRSRSQGPDRPHEGRDNSLAGNESFTKTQAKIESAQGPGGLVPRRRQDHQARAQGQRQGQRGPDASRTRSWCSSSGSTA